MRLILLLVLMVARAYATACNATALWPVLNHYHVLVQLEYRFAGSANALADAFAYYEDLCQTGRSLSFFPMSACDYLNASICQSALNGSMVDVLRVSDAALSYSNVFVSGSHGCPDIMAKPVLDKQSGLASCTCPPGTGCVVTSSGANVVAAADEPTTFFEAAFWLLLAVVIAIVIASIGMNAWSNAAADRLALSRTVTAS